MKAALALALLLASGAANDLVTEPLPDGRFRTTITYNSSGPPEYIARVLLRLRDEASRVCAGRAPPVIIGALELNPSPDHRNRLNLTQTFSCGQPSS